MSHSLSIPFARVDCTGNESAYVAEVLASGWLTTASKTKELEERVANYLGTRHALAVNSCTSGLHLALDALGVNRGDKVFVPSMTFTSSAEVIRYMGADPIGHRKSYKRRFRPIPMFAHWWPCILAVAPCQCPPMIVQVFRTFAKKPEYVL